MAIAPASTAVRAPTPVGKLPLQVRADVSQARVKGGALYEGNQQHRGCGVMRSCGKCGSHRAVGRGRTTKRWGWVSMCCLQPVIDQIQELMALHSITPGEIKAVEAVTFIQSLMHEYGISLDELREEPAGTQGQAPVPQDRVTRCPSVTHDSRFQVADADAFEGSFMAEWRRLRGGHK